MQYNILMVGIETCRKDALQCYNPKRNTSFINEFAEKSLVFNNYYTVANNTYQSWGCAFTGKYAHNHNISIVPKEQLKVKLIDTIFKDNGYSVCIDKTDDFNIMGSGIDFPACNDLELISPFFCFNGSISCHSPYGLDFVSNQYTVEQVIDAHALMVFNADSEIEAIIRPFLDRDDTIIVLVTDHGDHIFTDNQVRAEHFDNIEEDTINVPLIIYHPNIKPRAINDLFASVDLLPTLLGFCGLKSSEQFDGLDYSSELFIGLPLKDRSIYVGPTITCKEFKIISSIDGQINIAHQQKMINNEPNRRAVLSRYQDYQNREYVNSLFEKLGRVNFFNDNWLKRSEKIDNLCYISDKGYLEHLLSIADVQTGMKVLDAGAGSGVVSMAIAERNREVDVIAVDQCYYLLNKIGNYDNIKKYVADLIGLLFIDSDSIDLIICRMVLHSETDRLANIMNELYRVLKPGGRLIISEGVPMEDGLLEFYRSFLTKKETREVFTKASLLSLLETNKYHNIEVFDYILNRQSINDWLENCCVNEELAKEIYKIHQDAAADIKQKLNLVEENNDIYCDFKFATIRGVK